MDSGTNYQRQRVFGLLSFSSAEEKEDFARLIAIGKILWYHGLKGLARGVDDVFFRFDA